MRSLFDELSATYDATGIDFFGQIARTLVARAGLSEGSTVLDIGCGAGAALLAAAEVVGPTGTVIGIDLAEGMVERASRADRERALENVVVQVGDAEAPPTAPRSVDAIVASLVVFFLPTSSSRSTPTQRRWSPEERSRSPPSSVTTTGHLSTRSSKALRHRLRLPRGRHCLKARAGSARSSGRTGFHSVSIDDVTHQVEFPSLEAFHEWDWSTGSRATWSAIPAEDRIAARTAVDAYLDSLERRRGALRLETAVRYTRAVAA